MNEIPKFGTLLGSLILNISLSCGLMVQDVIWIVQGGQPLGRTTFGSYICRWKYLYTWARFRCRVFSCLYLFFTSPFVTGDWWKSLAFLWGMSISSWLSNTHKTLVGDVSSPHPPYCKLWGHWRIMFVLLEFFTSVLLTIYIYI